MDIDELWRQVVENPDDIGYRLVLADALIEEGDPRGELIALQCRGADANIFVGANDIPENPAERVSELVAANWERWLGDAAPALRRQGSTFRDGLLSSVQVGTDRGLPIAWERIAAHRELCALERVSPLNIRGEDYAVFLHGLVRDPAWVDVHLPGVIRALRAKREHWAIRGIRMGGITFTSRGRSEIAPLATELRLVAEMAKALEIVEIPPMYGAADELFALALQMPKQFPNLQKLRLETYGGFGDAEPRFRALSFVEIV